MKRTVSRIASLILLALAGLLITSGILFSGIDAENSALHFLHARTQTEHTLHDRLITALEDTSEQLERVTKRTGEAVTASEAVVSDAEAALEAERSGAYDPDTAVGRLGQQILEAQSSGTDIGPLMEQYTTVYNAALIVALDELESTVSRSVDAVQRAIQSLETLDGAIREINPDAPGLSNIEPVELSESQPDAKRTEALLSEALQLQASSTEAADSAAALNVLGSELIEQGRQTLKTHPISFSAQAVDHATVHYPDMLIVGGALALAGLVLLILPAQLAESWKNPMFRKGFWFLLTVTLLGYALHYADGELWALMRQGVIDTLYMTIPATLLSYLVGLPLGVLLVITAPGHIRPNPTLNSLLGTVVNFLRSIPFIILLVMLFDVTRLVMGTAIGTRAVIFPLFISAFPYVARIVEGSLNEVDSGVIEAAQSMGSTHWQIIRKVLVPEALPSLINGAAICMTTILAYTAMAGSAGGDGLGKIAITYGLNYREYDIMYISSLLLVALVQIIQIGGGILMRALDHRR